MLAVAAVSRPKASKGEGGRGLRTALIAIYPASPSLELDRETQRGSGESRPFSRTATSNRGGCNRTDAAR